MAAKPLKEDNMDQFVNVMKDDKTTEHEPVLKRRQAAVIAEESIDSLKRMKSDTTDSVKRYNRTNS